MCPEPRIDRRSFVAEGVDALLMHWQEPSGPASVVPRSPLGPQAVRVRPQAASAEAADALCRDLAGWLGRQAWVAQAVARPPHVYLQAATSLLVEWVEAGLGARLLEATHTSRQASGVIRFADPWASGSRSLERFREAAVGQSVRALLEFGGCALALQHAPAPPPGQVLVELDAQAGGARTVRVEGIDLPQGALRARCGGAATAGDIVGLLRTQAGLAADPDIGRVFDPADLLRFTLLSCPRAERIALTDARLLAGSRGAAEVLAARRLAAGEPAGPMRQAPPPAHGDRALRDLAQQIDLFELALARASAELDPCELTRFVLAVAERVRVAGAALRPFDGLRSAAWRSIDAAMRLAGISVQPLSDADEQHDELVMTEP